jgi:hypothetical protein
LLTIADDSLLLAPLLNIESAPWGRIAVEIPKTAPGISTTRLYAFAYWVGVGDACLADYAALEKTVPADWSRPGAPVALGAYGLSRPLILPPVKTADVAFVFNQSGERIGPKNVASLFGLSLKQNAKIITRMQLDATLKAAEKPGPYRFFACFENRNTVITHPVRLKVVAYYQKEKSRSIEIKPLYSNRKNQ